MKEVVFAEGLGCNRYISLNVANARIVNHLMLK